MTEEQLKVLTKFAIDNSNRLFTKEERVLIKHFVDRANNMGELVGIIAAVILVR